MVPAIMLFEVGYFTGLVFYLLPFTSGMIAIYPVVAYFRGWKLCPPLAVISLLVLFYASSLEVVAAFVLAIYLTAVIVQVFKRERVQSVFVPFLLLSIAGVVFILLTPGNRNRANAELQHFPGFEDLSIFRRFEMGYSSAMQSVFMNGYLPVLVFFIALLLFGVIRRTSVWKIAFSSIPLLGFVALSTQAGLFWHNQQQNNHIVGRDVVPVGRIGSGAEIWLPHRFVNAFTPTGLLNFDNNFSIVVFLSLTLLLICTVIALYLAFGFSGRFFIVLAALAGGFASKVILAFSPTVWGSGMRTDTFLVFSFVVAALALVEPLLDPEALAVKKQYAEVADSVGF